MDTQHHDVIVIGGGPIGQSTAYQLSQRQAKTAVLEQFTFANQLGSSAGVSRQFRLPYPDAYMVELVKQSIPLWAELQERTPVPLMDKVGTLWFGDPTVQSTEGNIGKAKHAMTEKDIPFTTLTAAQLENDYHFRDLPSTYTGIFQADGASVNLAATIQTLLSWNEASSFVTLLDQSPAQHIEWRSGAFHVTTPRGIVSAPKLVIAPGPFANSVFNLLDFQVEATYWNMASAFYRKTEPDIQYPTWFVFQNPVGDSGNQFYGFPEVGWDHPDYIRVASDFVQMPLDSPEQRTLIPNTAELGYTQAWVRDHMTGLEPTPTFTSTCLVALSKIPNKELIIDVAPEHVPHHEDIVIYATGWAGKFVPLVGRVLSDLTLDGQTPYDISHFRLGDTYFTPTPTQEEKQTH